MTAPQHPLGPWPERLIVVPITGKTINQCMAQFSLAVIAHADGVEFRFDTMNDVTRRIILETIPTIANKFGRPELKIIMTFRTEFHGGQFGSHAAEAMIFWEQVFLKYPEAVNTAFLIDWEYEMVSAIHCERLSTLGGTPIPWGKILASYHSIDKTPNSEKLFAILAEMGRTRVGMMKIACRSKSAEDNQRILDLYKVNDSNKPLLAIAMGPGGAGTRILSFAEGVVFTFGCIDVVSSAAGIPPVEELLEIRKSMV